LTYLQDIQRITKKELLQPDYPSGTLVITDSQAVIDECLRRKLPVAAFEHDSVSNLKCDYILVDVDDVDDIEFENIYRRYMGIPLDIAQTERTYIREFAMKDLDDLFELYNKPGITEYMEPLFEYEKERQYEENYIEYVYKLYGFGMWLIFDKTTNKLIGRAGIEVRETCEKENQAELGFCIASDMWRRGLAYEVCTCIIKIAREEYGLTSLIARCDPDNKASRGLLTKLGFYQIGSEPDGDFRYYREII